MKIAVIRKNGIGDFIAGCVPVCNFLLEKYGNVEFHFFMSQKNASVARLFYPNACVHIFPGGGNKYLSHWRMAQQWKRLNFDIGISPAPNSPKLNNLFLYWLGAQLRYGNTHGIISKLCLNTPSFEQSAEKSHEHVGLLSLKILDSKIQEIPPKFFPTVCRNVIDSYHVDSDKPYIMVEVSNARVANQFLNSKLADILNTLAYKFKFSVLITGLAKDEEIACALSAALKMPSEVHVTLNFDEYVNYVNAADIVLCGDGGLGHLAGALGKKVVACYAGTSLSRWHILGDKVVHICDSENVNKISDEKIMEAIAKYLLLEGD